MSLGLGPGTPGPVTMRDGKGPVPGLPAPPPRISGPARWFGLGVTTGVLATVAAILIMMAVLP